jgi:hypothetical protein
LIGDSLRFTFSYQQPWVLISTLLKDRVETEIKAVFEEILSVLTPAHKKIWLQNAESNLLDACIGIFERGQSFNVINGYGLESSGLMDIFYKALSIKTLEFGALFIVPSFFCTNEIKSASYDTLKGSPEKRKEEITCCFYKAIASKANLLQLNILIADSKDKECPGIKLLGNTESYHMYCDTLAQLKTKKLEAQSIMLHTNM